MFSNVYFVTKVLMYLDSMILHVIFKYTDILYL